MWVQAETTHIPAPKKTPGAGLSDLPRWMLPRLSCPGASHATVLGRTLAVTWSLLNHREHCHQHQVLGLAHRCHLTPTWMSLKLHGSVHRGHGAQGGEPDQSSWACHQNPASHGPQGIIRSNLMGLKHSVPQTAIQNPGCKHCGVL